MYNLEHTIKSKHRSPVSFPIEKSFCVKKVFLQGGVGLVIGKAKSNSRVLLQGDRPMTAVVGLLNLLCPKVEKGVLSFEITNPTEGEIWFKLEIT